MPPPNCSLDDIDLSALKVSEIEIVRASALAKADYRRMYKRRIECEMKSFHGKIRRNNNRCGRDFFSSLFCYSSSSYGEVKRKKMCDESGGENETAHTRTSSKFCVLLSL